MHPSNQVDGRHSDKPISDNDINPGPKRERVGMTTEIAYIYDASYTKSLKV
jgi:hypothetical protein